MAADIKVNSDATGMLYRQKAVHCRIVFTVMDNRKLNRLINYDYSSNGLYFVTICTKDRVQYLSEITTGNGELIENYTEHGNFVGDGVLDVPQIKLTEYGRILDQQIIEMNSIYKNSQVIKYVIMSDHLHMIIYLFDDEMVLGTSRTPSPTNAKIPLIVSTLKRFVNKKIGFNIWQRSYHDHIIRNREELRQIWQYIDNNPINWANDIYNQNSWR